MKKIGVTLEVTKRQYRAFDISDEAYDRLVADWSLIDALGEQAFASFQDEVANDEIMEVDYAVVDEDYITIIDWDNP